MTGRIDSVAVWCILVLTLALSVVLGLITPYVLAALGVILLLMRGADGSLREAISPAPVTLLGIVVVLFACFAITARQPGDLLFIVNFVLSAIYLEIVPPKTG